MVKGGDFSGALVKLTGAKKLGIPFNQGARYPTLQVVLHVLCPSLELLNLKRQI